MLCRVQPSATPWTVVRQTPLATGFSSKNTWVGCHFLFQGIFLTQGLNPCLLHCQADSLPLSSLPCILRLWFFLSFFLRWPGETKWGGPWQTSLPLAGMRFYYYPILFLSFSQPVKESWKYMARSCHNSTESIFSPHEKYVSLHDDVNILYTYWSLYLKWLRWYILCYFFITIKNKVSVSTRLTKMIFMFLPNTIQRLGGCMVPIDG